MFYRATINVSKDLLGATGVFKPSPTYVGGNKRHGGSPVKVVARDSLMGRWEVKSLIDGSVFYIQREQLLVDVDKKLEEFL